MKLIYSIIITLIIVSVSCKKESSYPVNNNPQDTTKLPVDSNYLDSIARINTFISATIKGVKYKWTYLNAHRGYDPTASDYYHYRITEGISSETPNADESILFGIPIESLKLGVIDVWDAQAAFNFNNNALSEIYACGNTNEGAFHNLHKGSGKINITKIDHEEGKYTGTFSILAISDNNKDTIAIRDGIFNKVRY